MKLPFVSVVLIPQFSGRPQETILNSRLVKVTHAGIPFIFIAGNKIYVTTNKNVFGIKVVGFEGGHMIPYTICL
jgi:hypothetical protein